MNETKNIINPFIFYPTDKKTVLLDKQFNLELDKNTNTLIAYNDKIKIINIPNDPWFVVYMDYYIINLYCDINHKKVNVKLLYDNDIRICSIQKVFAYLYGMIDDINYDKQIFLKNRFIDNNGILIVDISRSNIYISINLYLYDNNYTYIKLTNVDIYVKISDEIANIIIDQGTWYYNEEKIGFKVRSNKSLKNNNRSFGLIKFIYTLYNGVDNTNGKLIRLRDNSIKFHDKLCINYIDYDIKNIICGNTYDIDGDRVKIYIYRKHETRYVYIDKFIYDQHEDEFKNHTWSISNNYIATNTHYLFLHRFIINLLLRDYGIDQSIFTSDIQIHHIDEDKFNNTIDNFYICSINLHSYIHSNIEKYNDIKSNIIEILTLGYIPRKYIDIPN